MKRSRRQFVTLLAALSVLHVPMALADRKHRERDGKHGDDDDDEHHHDYRDAASARRSGDALPLREILDEVGKTHKGQIVGIEFKRKDDVWIYEIKLVTEEGRYLEIYVDAKSKAILKVEGK